MTDEQKQAYDAFVDAGRKLLEVLKPITPDEVEMVNDQLIDLGWEDLLCDSKNPEAGGDTGLLAANVYELRKSIEEESNES
jgi:hypothetical protein